METSVYVNEKHGFQINFPLGWITEGQELDLTEQGAPTDGILKQIRVASFHPQMETEEDYNEKYEEVMVMKQVCCRSFLVCVPSVISKLFRLSRSRKLWRNSLSLFVKNSIKPTYSFE